MSKSPIKPKRIIEILATTLSKQTLEDDFILLYSIGQKQSESGVFNNQRLLIFNGKQKYIGYSNQIPKEIPFGSFSKVIAPKKKVNFESIQYGKSKFILNAIQIICPDVVYKGKTQKEKWVFTFKTNRLVEDWIRELRQYREPTAKKLKKDTSKRSISPAPQNIQITIEPDQQNVAIMKNDHDQKWVKQQSDYKDKYPIQNKNNITQSQIMEKSNKVLRQQENNPSRRALTIKQDQPQHVSRRTELKVSQANQQFQYLNTSDLNQQNRVASRKQQIVQKSRLSNQQPLKISEMELNKSRESQLQKSQANSKQTNKSKMVLDKAFMEESSNKIDNSIQKPFLLIEQSYKQEIDKSQSKAESSQIIRSSNKINQSKINQVEVSNSHLKNQSSIKNSAQRSSVVNKSIKMPQKQQVAEQQQVQQQKLHRVQVRSQKAKTFYHDSTKKEQNQIEGSHRTGPISHEQKLVKHPSSEFAMQSYKINDQIKQPKSPIYSMKSPQYNAESKFQNNYPRSEAFSKFKRTEEQELIENIHQEKSSFEHPGVPINKSDSIKPVIIINPPSHQNSMHPSQQMPMQQAVNSYQHEKKKSQGSINKPELRLMSFFEKSVSRAKVFHGEYEDWNKMYYLANDDIEIIMKFTQKCQEIIKTIVDQIPLTPTQRKYNPTFQQSQLNLYQIQGLLIKLAYFQQSSSTLIDRTQSKLIKNQFRNYKYLNSSTKNNGLIRVPLTCFIQYKGMYCLAKAMIKDYQEISSSQISTQLTRLEKITKIKKELFNSRKNVVLKYKKYELNDAVQEVVYADQLNYFVPLDRSSKQEAQFRGQLLELTPVIVSGQKIEISRSERTSAKIVSDLEDLTKLTKTNCNTLRAQLQSLQTIVISHIDLKRSLKKYGITSKYLSYMLKNCELNFIKKYLLSELLAKVCKTIMKYQLQQQIINLAAQKIKSHNMQDIEEILLESIVSFFNDLLSNTEKTEKLWRLIFLQTKKQFNIVANKDQICFGFFLSALYSNCGLQLNFEFFEKDREHLKTQRGLKSEFIQKFKMKSKYYQSNSHTIQKIIQIVNDPPSEQGFDTIINSLNLNVDNIPSFFEHETQEKIKNYVANFIDAQNQKEFQHLSIYGNLDVGIPTLSSVKLALIKIKWAIRKKNEESALQTFEKISDTIHFWAGQFHPLLGQFYDFFSLYYVTNGEYQQAITLGKSSLVNTIKLIGTNTLNTAQKYYQLGNIFFKVGKKEQALSHYSKTRQILSINKKTNIPQYGVISLKLALLYLNFGKISDTIDHLDECLKIFQKDSGRELELTQTFEIMQRAYEITQQKSELIQSAELCAQRLYKSQDPKIMQRTIKICLYPFLTSLNEQDRSNLLSIIYKFPLVKNQESYYLGFNYLKKKAVNLNYLQKFLGYLYDVNKYYTQIINKDLLRKHRGFQIQSNTETQQFLNMLEAILYLIDQSYFIAILQEYY